MDVNCCVIKTTGRLKCLTENPNLTNSLVLFLTLCPLAQSSNILKLLLPFEKSTMNFSQSSTLS